MSRRLAIYAAAVILAVISTTLVAPPAHATAAPTEVTATVVLVAAAAPCASRDRARAGFSIWGPYTAWTIGKCKAKRWNRAIVPMGAVTMAAYLCTRLEKIPGVGWIGTAVCLGWVAVKAGGIKRTFDRAVRRPGKCPQLRFYALNNVLSPASRVVDCHYP